MCDILTDTRYDTWRVLVDNMRRKDLPWNSIILFCGTKKDVVLQEVLDRKAEETFGERITEDQWKEIAQAKKDAFDQSIQAERDRRATAEDAILGQEAESDIQASENTRSSWMTYKEKLIDRNFDETSVANIERSSLAALRRMSRSTEVGSPKKGLVVGHVQSGKTANMAGMMAIGADNGYNVFIVLSGTIENLRKQTEQRLFSDLHSEHGNLNWQYLENLRRNSTPGNRIQDLRLRSGSSTRYLTVILKNSTRLQNLLDWMKQCKDNLRNMRLVIIDDEADQAGINTADVTQERTRINQLIVDLTKTTASAVNYVAFTATPYANFLNEAYPESLYPRDFIIALPQPNEHFGPGQVFGFEGLMANEIERDGLDILRSVTKDDLSLVQQIHKEGSLILPDTLKNALAWFLCSVAVTRLNGKPDPRSMLIHSSQRVIHHRHMAEAVSTWLLGCRDEVLNRCQSVWKMETERFNAEKFSYQFPDYPRGSRITGYPEYSEILGNLEEVLEKISHIQITDDDTFEYHRGVHLCIDNGSRREVIDGDNQYVRLLYPKAANETVDFSTAFIVIGGNTLSRGLTLEGLTSTFFLRSSGQMDTLMQMGRWFGFRRDYELLPRIWMTDATRAKFKYMTIAEQELREELKVYSNPPYLNPSDFAPRVKNSHSFAWLRPTSRNRMQSALPIDLDFSGARPQTTIFHSEPEILLSNIHATELFLNHLNTPEAVKDGAALLWRGINFEEISEYLHSFKFHTRSRLFADIEAFTQWYEETAEKINYTDWNVVAAGMKTRPAGEPAWRIGNFTLAKVNRTRKVKESGDGAVSIGALRNPADLLADLNTYSDEDNYKLDNIIKLRREGGLEYTPQLLIYRVSKNSLPRGNEKQDREALGTAHDVIGISMWIPLVRGEAGNPNFATSLQMQIPEILDNDTFEYRLSE